MAWKWQTIIMVRTIWRRQFSNRIQVHGACLVSQEKLIATLRGFWRKLWETKKLHIRKYLKNQCFSTADNPKGSENKALCNKNEKDRIWADTSYHTYMGNWFWHCQQYWKILRMILLTKQPTVSKSNFFHICANIQGLSAHFWLCRFSGFQNIRFCVEQSFQVKLEAFNNKAPTTYEFRRVQPKRSTGKFSNIMLERCWDLGSKDWKPLCDHKKWV